MVDVRVEASIYKKKSERDVVLSSAARNAYEQLEIAMKPVCIE